MVIYEIVLNLIENNPESVCGFCTPCTLHTQTTTSSTLASIQILEHLLGQMFKISENARKRMAQ